MQLEKQFEKQDRATKERFRAAVEREIKDRRDKVDEYRKRSPRGPEMRDQEASLLPGLHIHGVPPQLSRERPGAAVGLPRISEPRHVPTAWRYEIIRRCRETCHYCGRSGDARYGPDCWPWHIDHVRPVSKGGKTTLDNLTLACRHCNLSKNAKLGWRPFTRAR